MTLNTARKIAFFIATLGGIGKLRIMPKALGALAAYLFAYLFFQLFGDAPLEILLIMGVSFSVILVIVGRWAALIHMVTIKRYDPEEVIIDEFTGQFLALVLCFPAIIDIYKVVNDYMSNQMALIFTLLLPYFIFRYCARKKPFPIRQIVRRMRSSWGVMMDDVAGALLTTGAMYLLSALRVPVAGMVDKVLY